jgi:TetR/AcrR family transcriptional regulator, mexCD-oprJ operon repressor
MSHGEDPDTGEMTIVLCRTAMPKPNRAHQAAAFKTPPQSLQERVSAAIVAAAANVFATEGGAANMTEIAAAAGVARATIYRYFPTRDALLARVAEVAVGEAAKRLAEAQLGRVEADEAIVRIVRALVDVGDYFAALTREQVQPEQSEYRRAILQPLRRVIERGQANGLFRADIGAEPLANALLALVAAMLPSLRRRGRDDAVAAMAGFFVDGARAPVT